MFIKCCFRDWNKSNTNQSLIQWPIKTVMMKTSYNVSLVSVYHIFNDNTKQLSLKTIISNEIIITITKMVSHRTPKQGCISPLCPRIKSFYDTIINANAFVLSSLRP